MSGRSGSPRNSPQPISTIRHVARGACARDETGRSLGDRKISFGEEARVRVRRDAHAQAHITALGDLIEATAQKAPAHLHAELRAASRAFTRAQRSQIRAENQAAHTLRRAARDLAHTATGPDGSALATLLAALVWATIVAAHWHEAKDHAHQTEAARQTLHHLQAVADRALMPVVDSLATRRPSDQARQNLAHDVRAAVPDHADRILTDPAWPALATVLADAEAGGHKPHQLLKEAAAQRELTTARQPARVLIARIQHTSRNPAPNPRAEAARRRSTLSGIQRHGHGEHVAMPVRPAVVPGESIRRRQL